MTQRAMFATCLLVTLLLGACLTPMDDEEGYEDGDDYGELDGKADGPERLSPPCEPGELSLSACALLGTIAYAEGTGPRYDLTFAFHVFTSYDDHPRVRYCSGSLCSTAAGRYQILEDTWDGIREGLDDFTPASQDQAGLRLIRGRGVSNIDGIDTLTEFRSAINKLNREWASLPGSPYGQPTYSMTRLWTQFKRLRGLP
jgi:muramidase (phage lysozyme)